MKTTAEQAKEIRVVAFGMGSMMNVVCVQPPKKIEDCGMYVHVEDIPKFLEFQKRMEGPCQEKTQPTK